MTRAARQAGALAWGIWLVGVAVVVFKSYNQSAYAVLNPGIGRALELSATDIGLLGACYTFSYACVTLLSGGVLDHYGARRALAGAMVVIIAGALVFASAADWPRAVLGQLLMGAGGAFGFPGLAYLTRHWFDVHRFGIVFGLAQTVAAFSAAGLMRATGLLVETFDWREILLLQALAGVLLLAAVLLLVREPAAQAADAASRTARGGFWRAYWRSLLAVVRRPLLWEVALVSGFALAILFGIGAVWGVRALASRGIEQRTATDITAMIWIGAGIGAPLLALASRALGSYRLAGLIFSGGLIVITAVLAWSDTLPLVAAYALVLLIGVFSALAFTCFYVTAEVVDKQDAGVAFAFLTFVSFLVMGAVMPIPGKLLDSGWAVTPSQSLLVYPAVMLAATLLMARRPWPYQPSQRRS